MHICYTPFDLIGYVARYGDISSEENRVKCTKLIVDTYNKCKDIFMGQQFFLEDEEKLNKEGYPKKFEYYYKDKHIANTSSSKKAKQDDITL